MDKMVYPGVPENFVEEAVGLLQLMNEISQQDVFDMEVPSADAGSKFGVKSTGRHGDGVADLFVLVSGVVVTLDGEVMGWPSDTSGISRDADPFDVMRAVDWKTNAMAYDMYHPRATVDSCNQLMEYGQKVYAVIDRFANA